MYIYYVSKYSSGISYRGKLNLKEFSIESETDLNI